MTDDNRCLSANALIGMVHLLPLPGSPVSQRTQRVVTEHALADARTLAGAGFDALMIENFGDAPFRATRVEPHTVAMMTVIARRVRDTVSLPIGINVLRNDPRAALAVAGACGAAFIRVNVHVGVYAADQGIIEGRADDTLRYRRDLGDATAIFADVHVKHARPMSTPDLAEAAEETAYRGRADALIVSGTGTGKPTDRHDVECVRKAVPDRPLYIGSGVTADTIREDLGIADGVIVGTALKPNRRIEAPIDAKLASTFVEAARS